MIRVWTKCTIQKWDTMAKKYGITKVYQNIKTPWMCFIQEMKPLCELTGKVIEILWKDKDKFYKLDFYDEKLDQPYRRKLDTEYLFTKYMFTKW